MMSEATEDRIFEAETPAPEAPEAPKLTRQELLEVENLSLKAQVVAQRKELFLRGVQAQIDGFDAQLTELRGDITTMQKTLSAKYGIDFTKQQVQAGTGDIIAAGGK